MSHIIKVELGKNIYHMLNGQIHNDNDQPAVQYQNGDQEWYHHGKLHRDGNAARILNYGQRKEYYQHGQYLGVEISGVFHPFKLT